MSDTTAPAPRFTDAYIAANRLAYNDVAEQDGTGEGYWFCLIERDQESGWDYKACACGCGEQVTSAKRNFLPGHDQRLMGILVRAERENLEVSWTDGGMTVTGSGAMDYAELVLGETGIAKLERYLATTPKRARKGKKAPAVVEAPRTDPLPSTVKVGRWEYPVININRDGNGAIVAVEYKNRTGGQTWTDKWSQLV